ncbi:MAG TPA: metalloregulator ArsR/SmtB family transcription factor [Kofleriaceae bacterium]|jgi:DNA-binding transcriptional ArsR family regulator
MSRSALQAGDAAPVFAALGDPTRLAVVRRLCAAGPQSIAQLSDGADVTRQAITKHLLALADAGLVRDRKLGRERIFELEPRRLAAARSWIDQISLEWDSAIERLRKFVED